MACARAGAACCLRPHGFCGRRMARPPARLGGLTSFGASPRSPPVPSGPSGALHTSGSGCADQWFGASACCSARPRRRPRAPQPGPPGPPAPSTPVGPGVLTCACASARSPARPRRRPRAPQPGRASALAHIAAELPNFACNSPAAVSMFELYSLELQRFQTLLKLHPIELHASFLRSGRIGACWRRRRSPLARCAVV